MTGDARNRIAAEAGKVKRRIAHPAEPQQINTQRVQAALVHERSRHHAVIDEMTRQKPRLRINVRLGANQADAVLATARIEMQHTIDKLHLPTGKSQIQLQRNALKQGAETRCQIAAT